MNLYIIDPTTLTIIEGPARAFKFCGNPDVLLRDADYYDISDGTRLVKEVRPSITELQKIGQRVVESERVTYEVLDKTQDELDADIANFNASQRSQRQAAYQAESDPIFFDYQRGEATKADWDAKVAEIKVRFPYAEDVNADGVVTQADSPSVWTKFKSFFGF